jgi:outer membrane biosynthesis protein TonB
MDNNAVGLHKRCGPTAFFVIFAKKSGAGLFNRHIAQAVGGGGIINLAEKPQNTKREVKIMRRKKLLRQVAAAAVALSMAASLSAPAFAATFDLSNGGLVITAGESGITVKRDDGTSSTYGADEEIVITGSYSSANGATQTAEENRQEENQPVTPAKAPAKEETPEAEDAPAAEKKQEQKDTEAPADPEQNTETENKDNNSDPDNEEKKEQNAPANGELNASAGEGQEPKAEDEGQPKPEAKASAEATASASDDASNGPRKAPARSSGEGERRGIIQIFANTLVKLKLKDATIDQPNAADTNTRGMAAIDIQGSGNVEITVEGQNTLKGSGHVAGIQKNDDVSTGKLTITASDTSQTLNVSSDLDGAAIGGSNGRSTKHIEINGGTVNTQGRIGSGYGGGSAEDIVIKGNAVVNANGGIGGGTSFGEDDKDGRTSITISGNAKVTATDKVDTGSYGYGGSSADLAVIGGGLGDTAEITISGNAVVKAKAEVRKYIYGSQGTGAVIGGGAGIYNGKKSSAKVTIEDNAQVTAENYEYGGGAGIGGGANGTGEVIIGGKAQVKATGSAEKHIDSGNYSAGAAIGNGGATSERGTSIVQTYENGRNRFTIANDIADNAKIEMTIMGNNSSNTVTQTRQNGEWVTSGEQTPEECDHSNPSVEIIVAPTCTEDGYKVTKCSRCGKELGSRTKTANALGHQFVETTVAPTCTESGYTVSKCTRCGEEEGERTNLVAPLGHEYKNGVCIRCGAPEPQENGGSSSAAPNYTVTGAETYETSVVDGRYIIAVPSEDAALNAVLGDLRAIKAQGADVVVFRTRSRESSLVIDEMLAMGPDATPFVLTHNGGEAQLTINGAAHNELIH